MTENSRLAVTAQELISLTKELECLKDVTRNSWTSGGRRESVAEHSWRLSLMCLLLKDSLPGVDMHKTMQICLIHDLGEAYSGDISAKYETASHQEKLERERQNLSRLFSSAGENTKALIFNLWDEYNGGKTPESLAAKYLDKLETIIQHNQGANPPDFDYAFNLDYGKNIPMDDPLLLAARTLADAETLARENKKNKKTRR